jgi:SAM-dependent methyltransferase
MKDSVWIDIGCGPNAYVKEFGCLAKIAVGVDILDDDSRTNAAFIRADLRKLPLATCCATLVTLRMVAEHLERVPQDFSEINRVLASGGRLIVLTTNTWSPIIFLPGVLPYSIKKWLIGKIFNVPDDDIFPTFHKFNTPGTMARGVYDMKLSSLEFIEGVPLRRPLLTCALGFWYCVTRLPLLWRFRSNLLAIFQKV